MATHGAHEKWRGKKRGGTLNSTHFFGGKSVTIEFDAFLAGRVEQLNSTGAKGGHHPISYPTPNIIVD